jgi:hypothetical protein
MVLYTVTITAIYAVIIAIALIMMFYGVEAISFISDHILYRD